MKSLLMAGAIAATLIGGASLQDSTVPAGAPWQVGRCYRVFPSTANTFHTFKVLEPASGGWVRVQPSPSSPVVPGARPQAPLWINGQSPFAVQEWSCDSP